MKALKRLRVRLDQMTDYTYSFLRGALFLSITMTACSLLLFLQSGGLTATGYAAYKSAQELMSFSALVLFLAAALSAFVEEGSMSHSERS